MVKIRHIYKNNFNIPYIHSHSLAQTHCPIPVMILKTQTVVSCSPTYKLDAKLKLNKRESLVKSMRTLVCMRIENHIHPHQILSS